MIKIIGVRFKYSGKVYYFDPGKEDVKTGDSVIVETVRGLELGDVVFGVKEVDKSKVTQPLKEIIRVATDKDILSQQNNEAKSKYAFTVCREKISNHDINMKLVAAQTTFDGTKILFYYTADGRVDFRNLVKELASLFKTRIEMRQIGVRDESKIIGGYGICGRPFCCNSYMEDFHPVSIKMAKDQNLSLNPVKISGTCGRLMCCLKHEQEAYDELLKKMPDVGAVVKTSSGQGVVKDVNLLRERVKVEVTNEDNNTMLTWMDAADVKLLKRSSKSSNKSKEDDDTSSGELEKILD